MDEQIDRLKREDEVPISRITQKRVTSSQQRLKREFQMMTAACLMAPSWITMVQRNMDGISNRIVFLFFVFFMVMAALKGGVWWKLAHMDCKRMTVKEALISTYQLEKRQKTATLVGIFMALPVLACFMVELYSLHEVYVLHGAFCGLVVGLFVGLRVRGRIKREIQAMREALNDELDLS